MYFKRVIEVVDIDDVHQRTEGLVLHDTPFVLRSRYRWCHVETISATFRIDLFAATKNLAAHFFNGFDGLKHIIDSILINQWPHQHVFVKWVSDTHTGVHRLKTFNQLLAHTFLYQYTARRSTTLTSSTHSTKHNGTCCHFEVCIFEYDHGIVAAQLENSRTKTPCDFSRNVCAHATRTGCRNNRQTLVSSHCFTNGIVRTNNHR